MFNMYIAVLVHYTYSMVSIKRLVLLNILVWISPKVYIKQLGLSQVMFIYMKIKKIYFFLKKSIKWPVLSQFQTTRSYNRDHRVHMYILHARKMQCNLLDLTFIHRPNNISWFFKWISIQIPRHTYLLSIVTQFIWLPSLHNF